MYVPSAYELKGMSSGVFFKPDLFMHVSDIEAPVPTSKQYVKLTSSMFIARTLINQSAKPTQLTLHVHALCNYTHLQLSVAQGLGSVRQSLYALKAYH